MKKFVNLILSKLFPYDQEVFLSWGYNQTRSNSFKVLNEEESRLEHLVFKTLINDV